MTPNDTNMHTLRLLDAQPSSDPMVLYFQFDPQQTAVKLKTKTKNAFKKIIFHTMAII